LGEEFTGFAKGFDDLLNPISRLIDIGGRLIPVGSVTSEVTDTSKGIWASAKSNDPADIAIPPGTADPPIIIHGEEFGEDYIG
jgi:hypothetical protein